MAVKPFSKEELNFFKFSSVVLDEFPKALRQTFISMWDNKVGELPGYQLWDDSVAVRNMLLRSEGGKTDIPINKSIQEWDNTALFKATIFAKTFVLPSSKGAKKTLAEYYLKGRKPKPSPFHPTVNSPSGDQDETLTLAIDQLRLLRNTLCHAAEPRIIKPDFDNYVQLAKDAFIAANIPSTASIDAIGGLSQSDFPTEKVNELNECIQKEIPLFLQHKVIEEISKMREAQETTKEEFKEEFKKIRSELIHQIEPKAQKLNNDEKRDILGNPSSLPASCLPAKVPHFTGRKEECKKIIASLTSESTRLVSICGSPGFGKTSTAVAIGHNLQSQGQSVYYFTFRGINTKDEFISKLCSFFKRSTKSSLIENLTPADELCLIFEEIHSRFFVILDNLDDLLESKDDILHFIEEILARCQSVRFLTTTRESLQFLDFKIVGNESIRIGPMDPLSSASLVSEFLTSADQAVITQIVQICGNVALAIKLLCSLIKEDDLTPSEYLEEIREGPEDILERIDNPNYPTDLRIQILFQSSFNRLSREEQEAFISLSAFAGVDFDFKVAVAVIGGKKSAAKRTLKNLQKKSLIDLSSRIDSNFGDKFQVQHTLGNLEKKFLIDSRIDSKMFSLHPLLQSFAIEKGENELKEVSISSKVRLYDFYIDLFAELNEQFLTGKSSMAAFVKFCKEEKNIWSSFHEGFQNEGLCNKLFDVLAKAELFLDALHPVNWKKIKSLYDLASNKAQEQGNDVAYASLAVSKCFITLTAENNETKEKIHSLPAATTPKCLLYQGMEALSDGRSEFGIQQIRNGLLHLNDNAEHKILKILALQLLTFYYDSSGNSKKSTQFSKMAIAQCETIGDWGLLLATALEDDENIIQERILCEGATSLNQPLILWAIYRLSMLATKIKYSCVQMKTNLRITVQAMQTQIEASPVLIRALAAILQTCDLALIFLSSKDKAKVKTDHSHADSSDRPRRERGRMIRFLLWVARLIRRR